MSSFVIHRVYLGDDVPSQWVPLPRLVPSTAFASIEAALIACDQDALRRTHHRAGVWVPMRDGARHRSQPRNGVCYQVTRRA